MVQLSIQAVNNQNLFSNHYLENLIRKNDEWRSNEHKSVFYEIKKIYDDEKPFLEDLNESTEPLIDAPDGSIVLNEFGATFRSVGQEGRHDDIFGFERYRRHPRIGLAFWQVSEAVRAMR